MDTGSMDWSTGRAVFVGGTGVEEAPASGDAVDETVGPGVRLAGPAEAAPVHAAVSTPNMAKAASRILTMPEDPTCRRSSG